ncbi:Intracellular distribution of mitochondria [Coemansia sp. RSA 1722]|nr:Intracellular distribution of mitochondria [Coemansia sp. RSA 485]KAJ2595274.1 Intracellular distribution of mitochondria [Coemansia sp. RSA 1722]
MSTAQENSDAKIGSGVQAGQPVPEAANQTAAVSVDSQEPEAAGEVEGNADEVLPEEVTFKLTVKAPNGAVVPIIATAQETIQDLKQVVSENQSTIEYSCFFLALDGQRLNDFAELGEIEGLAKESQLELHEDRYTERDARHHVIRLRELLLGPATANPSIAGLDAGVSVFNTIKNPDGVSDEADEALVEGDKDKKADGGDASGAASAVDGESAESAKAGKGSSKKSGKGKGKGSSTAGSKSESEVSGSEAPAETIKPLATHHAFKDYEISSVPPFSVVSAEKAIAGLALPQCVKQIMLSGWNPVPRYRQLKGDLLYLLVTTIESQTYHITASRDGFYVNSSSLVRFSPEPYSEARGGQSGARDAEFYQAHSLIALLRRLSPRFARGLDDLQKEMSQREAVEVLPFVSAEQAASPWLVRGNENRVPQTYDVGQPQEIYLRLGAQAADSLRDWNEELQSIREMPRGNLSERVVRDRQLHKWYSEFAEAAIQGAMAVVDGEMPPLNPTDPDEQHMYLRDNIFYSKGFDGRETFTELGGDAAAHVATGKDITGVRLLNQLDIDGLHTLGSVVVDYRGLRVVAQSVVPGIFRRQETTQIVYGSVDSGVTVGADEDFHKLLEPVAKALHFGEHAVADEAGNEVKLYTSADVKGLTGTDGRKYLLDLFRMTPMDIEFLESQCTEGQDAVADSALPVYHHRLVLLRPELLDIFWENSVRKAVQEYAVEKAKRSQKEESKAGGQTGGEGSDADKQPAETADKDKGGETKPSSDDALPEFAFSLDFSPDAFTPLQARLKAKEGEGSESAMDAAVRSASRFLRDVSVPAFARELASYTTSPLSGDALVTAMHQRGINMRYLGAIANLLPSDAEIVRNVRRLVVFEMVSRAVKHIVRGLFQATPAHLHSEALALVLNALVGTRRCASPAEHLSAEAKAVPQLAALTPKLLADEVRAQVALRFRFELAADFVESMVAGNERILLREVCQKIGAQLALRQYHFEQPTESDVYSEIVSSMGFGSGKMTKTSKRLVRERVDEVLQQKLVVGSDDVLNFVALTKVSTHNSSFADEAFEAGRMSLEQGQRQMGLELLLESLALHEQTFGFLHAESARCYAVVSLAHYDAGEHELAADFMTKAVVISERTVGLDNPLTIHNYLNLALYEHARGKTLLALRLMRHAMDLWGLVNSVDHPDLATAHNNIGVMLQSLRLFEDALKFIQSSYEIRLRLHGPDNVVVANAQHALAKAYALTGDFKAAVQVERDAHHYFSNNFGEEDPRTKETAEWLGELTFNAVRTAKLTKAAREKLSQAAALGGLIQMSRGSQQEGSAAAAAAGNDGTAAGGAAPKGSLPIDELLKFITGNSNRADKPRPSGGKRSKHTPKGSKR